MYSFALGWYCNLFCLSTFNLDVSSKLVVSPLRKILLGFVLVLFHRYYFIFPHAAVLFALWPLESSLASYLLCNTVIHKCFPGCSCMLQPQFWSALETVLYKLQWLPREDAIFHLLLPSMEVTQVWFPAFRCLFSHIWNTSLYCLPAPRKAPGCCRAGCWLDPCLQLSCAIHLTRSHLY